MKIWTLLLILIVLSGKAPGPVMAQNTPDYGAPILVGHITHVEGQLLRYVPEEQDWLAVVQDARGGRQRDIAERNIAPVFPCAGETAPRQVHGLGRAE